MAEMLTDVRVKEWEQKIDKMSQVDMAQLHRFAPAGHPVFDRRYSLHERFEKRFKELGGFTPTVSKAIG